MKRVFIIGAGPGSGELLTPQARKAIEGSDCVIAHRRLLNNPSFDGIPGSLCIRELEARGKTVFESASPGEITALLENLQDGMTAAVLVSGDTGFYSLAKKLTAMLGDQIEAELISGISSVAYFCAKIKSSWDDALLLSLHGRACNVADKVRRNHKVIMLTDAHRTPARIAEELCQNGLENATMTVGENLSYDNEIITAATAREARKGIYGDLCVVQVENRVPEEHLFIRDRDFVRGRTPMTKEDIRCLVINKLEPAKNDIVYDVGAGTGSVAIEIAMQIPEGKIYALEKNRDALELIKENKHKFGAANLEIVAGNAADNLAELPAPAKVFIGGSGGRLNELLDIVYQKNPRARIVINAITLETLIEASEYYKKRGDYLFEVIQVGVSHAREINRYHLLTAQNPVFIITASALQSADRKDTAYDQ